MLVTVVQQDKKLVENKQNILFKPRFQTKKYFFSITSLLFQLQLTFV